MACSGRPATQATVVVHPGDSCSEGIPAADPYDAVLARARCEHPDMLVHPNDYLVRRVASPPNVRRFALERARVVDAVYEVDASGAVRRLP